MTEPLYRRLLGAGFDRLPKAVRELHDFTGVSIWDGRADVERGRSLAARIAAALTSAAARGRRPAAAGDVPRDRGARDLGRASSG